MTTSSGFRPAAFRQKRNLALGIASEIAAPVLRPIASSFAKGKVSPPSQWRRGLILAHNHIGDVLYRTPSLQALHEGLPQCEWSFLTTPSSAEILKGNPHLSEVIPWSRGEHSWDIDAAHKLELKKRDFDVVLCTNTLKHFPDFVLATTLGIPNTKRLQQRFSGDYRRASRSTSWRGLTPSLRVFLGTS